MFFLFCFVFVSVREETDWQPDLGGDCKDTLATDPRIAVTFQFNGWCVALWMITCNGSRTEEERIERAVPKHVSTPGFAAHYLTLCWCAGAAGIHIDYYFPPESGKHICLLFLPAHLLHPSEELFKPSFCYISLHLKL